MPDLYAVFEGGGVKGIAHVGALARAEAESLSFKGFAGSSAGAIVAALAAAGYNAADAGQSLENLTELVAENAIDQWPGELVRILREVDYTEFLDGHDKISLEELKSIPDWMNKTGKAFEEKWWLRGTRTVVSLAWRQGLLRKLFSRLSSKKGIYGTASFLKWMHNLLDEKAPRDPHGNVTFGSIYARNETILKIIATDLVNRDYIEYDPYKRAGIEVARAVQASMSIPLFFEPYADGSGYQVDGGLVSNFPAWAFEEEIANSGGVILGFRLIVDRKRQYSITTLREHAFELFHTALEGGTALQQRGLDLIPIEIPIRKEISATKFDLTAAEQVELFFSGWHKADEVLSLATNRERLGLPIS